MHWFSSLLLLLLSLLPSIAIMARDNRDSYYYYYYYYETGVSGSGPGSVVIWSDNNQHAVVSNKPSQKCPENSKYTDCLSPCPWTCKRIKEFQFFAVRSSSIFFSEKFLRLCFGKSDAVKVE